MKKKIIPKKRNVKKKVAKKSKRKVKVTFPARPNLVVEQWGEAFEKLMHREPMPFNMLKGVFTQVKREGINGDPFSIKGNEESVSIVDHLRPVQNKVNEREGHLTDALRYASMSLKPATRGELGTAPAHYSHGKITPWEVIDDWDLEYYCGNASKYICRHKHKGNPVQDIQKAIDCLTKYKTILEKETAK